MGVLAVDLWVRLGHQRSVADTILCLPSHSPHRGCDPQGCLYGFEARISTHVAFGTNGLCENVRIQRARASAPWYFMDYVSN